MFMPFNPRAPITTKGLIFYAIIAAAMSLVGPFVLFATLKTSLTAFNSRSWSKAMATIARSQIVELIAPNSTRYDLEIEYRFSVDGKEYLGSRRAFGDRASGTKQEAQSSLEKYARDTRHTVWYESDDPTQSVLERGLNFDNFFLPGIGLLMTVAGPIILRDQIEYINQRRKLVQMP